MRALAVVLSGCLLAVPAFAQAADGTSAGNEQASAQENRTPAGASTSEEEPRRICRKIETNTGSRVPHRTVCLTEQQWRNYRPN